MNGSSLALITSWIALIVPLVSASLVSALLLRYQSRHIRLLCLLLLWVTLLIVPIQALAAMQILGWITQLTISGIAALQLAILAASVVLFLVYRPHTTNSLSKSAEAKPIFPSLPLYLKISLAVLACSYLIFAIDLCATFPKGSDALAYHIPVALRWLQQGSLRLHTEASWQFCLPSNGEVLQMLALATGKQFLIPGLNWISILVLALAAYPWALRFCDGNPVAATAALVLVFSIPIVEFQTFSAYVDLFGTAFLFAAVTFFAARYRPDPQDENPNRPRSLSLTTLALAAIACGVSAGTKTSFLPYCGLFFLITVYILWRERRLHQRSLALICEVVLLGIALPSAFWYVRALQATGNPLYPTQIALGRHVIFPGYESVVADPASFLVENLPGGASDHGDKKYVRHRAEWLIYPWTEWLRSPGDFPIVYGEASGLGGAFATFAVIGIGFALYRSFGISKLNRDPAISWRLVCFWFFLLFIWIFVMHRILRFGLPVWILACLLSAPALALMRALYPRAFGVLFVCAIASTCAVSSLVPFHNLIGHLLSHKWSRNAAYAYPAFIDDLPPGSRILNDAPAPEKDFAFAGKHLTNQVVTAFEAPKQLTPQFIASRHIDYIVQVSSSHVADNSSAAPPPSIPATQVFQATQFGSLWTIWKVNPPN